MRKKLPPSLPTSDYYCAICYDLEHMQTYPDYVYRPNKRKNEKRRQARKNAVATFNSQDTTTTNNYEGGEAGPIQIPIY
ncbi:unnamed protein product [Rhizophagus irregularis]|nr:unnamed protein product [Rhizophagus irregularis]